MSETPPENSGFTLDDFRESVRKATLDGMKDYDRERAEWEQAVAAQEAEQKKAEDDNKPKSGGGLGGWLLGGGKNS